MAFNVVVTHTAKLDIEKAVDWYNSKQEALGQRYPEIINKGMA